MCLIVSGDKCERYGNERTWSVVLESELTRKIMSESVGKRHLNSKPQRRLRDGELLRNLEAKAWNNDRSQWLSGYVTARPRFWFFACASWAYSVRIRGESSSEMAVERSNSRTSWQFRKGVDGGEISISWWRFRLFPGERVAVYCSLSDIAASAAIW